MPYHWAVSSQVTCLCDFIALKYGMMCLGSLTTTFFTISWQRWQQKTNTDIFNSSQLIDQYPSWLEDRLKRMNLFPFIHKIELNAISNRHDRNRHCSHFNVSGRVVFWMTIGKGPFWGGILSSSSPLPVLHGVINLSETYGVWHLNNGVSVAKDIIIIAGFQANYIINYIIHLEKRELINR